MLRCWSTPLTNGKTGGVLWPPSVNVIISFTMLDFICLSVNGPGGMLTVIAIS